MSTRPKRLSNTRSDDFFMGLKPESPVYDSFTHIFPVLQEINANININLKIIIL
jgi:hypothetical protein